MTNLSDTQAILLSSASRRDNGSILPFPASLMVNGGTMKSVDALITRDLVEERETCDPAAARRVEGEVCYGVFITTTGLAAIGVEKRNANSAEPAPAKVPPTLAAKINKTEAVLNLLRRPAGATLAELIEPTGWLPHTTRAALTGIRKKGHNVECSKRGDATCYRIVVTG